MLKSIVTRKFGSVAHQIQRHAALRFASAAALPKQQLASSNSQEQQPNDQNRLQPLHDIKQPTERVQSLAAQIGQLSLLETAQLVQQLKLDLGISDQMLMQAAPSAGGPSTSSSAAAQNASSAQDEKPAEAPKKSKFTLKLVKIDAATKAKVIREIKNIVPNINLVEAKKFVESAPKVVKENISKDECDKIKAALEAVGATIEVE